MYCICQNGIEIRPRVVKDDLDVGRDDPGPGALVQQRLPLLGPQVRVLVAEDELDGVEEVGLAGAVPADDDIVAGVEGLHDRLLAVRLEALDDDLLDVHGGGVGGLGGLAQVHLVPRPGTLSVMPLVDDSEPAPDLAGQPA